MLSYEHQDHDLPTQSDFIMTQRIIGDVNFIRLSQPIGDMHVKTTLPITHETHAGQSIQTPLNLYHVAISYLCDALYLSQHQGVP